MNSDLNIHDENARTANMGFCASRAGRSNFGILHRCTLVRAGRNSIGLLVVILYFYFFIGLQFRAGQATMPCLHKALFVMCHTTQQFHQRWGDSKNVLYL